MSEVMHLPEPRTESAPRTGLARVCVVTQEINGPSRNGGVGTAYTNLTQLLAEAGHEVTVLYLPGHRSDRHPLAHWQDVFGRRGIRLEPLPVPGVRMWSSEHLVRSYSAYLWLREHEFDVLHFHDWLGVGYYSILAKRQGLAFENTTIRVGVHSPTAWIREANQQLVDSVAELERDAIERRCVEWADVVWSPSEYLFRWMRERGWRLPRDHVVKPYPTNAERFPPPTTGVQPCKELVFFGRLETRKGLLLFCDAIDRLAGLAPRADLRITFLGRLDFVPEVRTDVLIRERAERWPFACQLLTNCNHEEALTYLRQPGRVAVVPSLMDNSPLTVLECLEFGIPFLASDVGGIPEVVAEADRERVLFAPSGPVLARRLLEAVRDGMTPARSAVDQRANAESWREWHRTVAPSIPVKPRREAERSQPRVSVCLVTHDRPELLSQAIASLRRQDYPHFEVVLVDDGSTQPEALACLDQLEPEIRDRGWKIVRQPNRYLGAARNTAAGHSAGEYLLFMDDDNLAKPHELSTLVRAAERTDADVVATFMDVFAEVGPDGEPILDRRWLVASVPSLAVGLSRNCFGDANSLVRRSAFDAVGGFSEDHGVTHEDWEFMAKAALHGLKMEVVPEALFWYRLSHDSMIRTTPRYRNYLRHLRPYLEEAPEPFRDIIRLAQGLALRHPEPMDVAVGPEFGRGRPLRYDIADAINARLKKLGVLHQFGRRLVQAVRRLGLRWRRQA